MSHKPYLVVKIGGRPASDAATLDALIDDMGKLRDTFRPVLVHGGGADVSAMSRRLGLEPRFVDGKRVTSAEEMDIVEMVLAGSVNTKILRRFWAASITAIGLGGADAGLFIAESADPAQESKTGIITACNPRAVIDTSGVGYVPVLSSVATNQSGTEAFNINADDAAMALAIALEAQTLVFLSDIPGILKDGKVISRIGPSIAESEIASGTISGGMIPKVRGALAALEKGVGTVVIGGYEQSGDLAAFIARTKGSSITKD